MIRALGVFVVGCALSVTTAAFAADRGTPEEAKLLATKAADYLRANGPDKAFAEFNKPDGQFRDRDLYVTVNDNAGKMMANGAIPTLVGRDNFNLKDVDGKAFVQEALAIKDQGWVEYKWPNPQTKAVEVKAAYFIRVDSYVLGVGAYKN